MACAAPDAVCRVLGRGTSGVEHGARVRGTRPTVYAQTASRLLAVAGAPPVPKRRVDPTQTVHEVTELHGAGWPLVNIAKVAGLSRVTVLESNLTTGVTAETEARVHHAWRVLHR